MILTCDLRTPSWHQVIIDFNICVTIHADIKSLSISTTVSPFPYHDYVLVSFITTTRVFSKSRNLAWASNRVLGGLQGRLPSGQCSSQIPVVVAWEEYLRLLLMKATDASHSKWWAERLAGRSINPTLENVNISFNHPLYCLMSRSEHRVVIKAGSFSNKA